MLGHCLNEYNSKNYYLDVIADNASAIRVYKSLGFVIEKEYWGFSGEKDPILCYQMKKAEK